jgi:ubiquinone/menaquinone biosynthesis C-methylase UbiE
MLNASFSFLLSLKIKDLSSNFRMYKKEVLDSFQTSGRNFDIIEEILLKVYCKGWQILEVPFNYQPRRYGRSHIKLIQLARDYLKTLLRMWYLRNSIYSADYDYRAFYSRIFLQRFWQRKRYDIILNFFDKKNIFLDVGCGSSKIISDNPDAIALDLSLDKLRYLRTQNNRLVNANADNLPFKDVSFDCVVCSQVIEHVANPNIFRQMHRVLRKNGLLIIGTPDYGKLAWRVIECLYSVIHKGGYADQHITHYTHKSLKNILETVGFDILDYAYICNAELVIKAKKI